MNDRVNSPQQWITKSPIIITAVGIVVVMVFTCSYLVGITATDAFLFWLILVVFLAIISICLEVASARGRAHLWLVAGGLAIASLITGIFSDSIRLMSIYCGGECGGSITLYPVTISIAPFIGAIVQSISPLRERHWLRVAITLITMAPAVSYGLETVIF